MDFPLLVLLLFGSSTSWSKINANNVIPILQEYASNITLPIGSILKIVCPILVSSQQDVGFYISWTVNDVDENMLAVDLRYEFMDGNKILQVKNLRSEDAGVYKCKGVTGYGVREAIFYIQILDEMYCQIPMKPDPKVKFKPCFLNSQMQNELSYHRVVKDVGGSVKFDCFAAGNPAPQYLWMKGKSSADWIDNITSIRQPTLRINNIRLEYSGHYTCKVYNPLGEISYTYTLIVRESNSNIPKITEILANVSTKLDAQAILVGTISCNCKPIIQWLKRVPNKTNFSKAVHIPNPEESEKNEYYIIIESNNEDSRISVETDVKEDGFLVSVLKFKSVAQNDAGKYILFVTRGNYGMSYRSVYLEVKGSSQKNTSSHPRLILYIAIPILILVVCIGIIFYCWSRNHGVQRRDVSKSLCLGSSSVSSSANIKSFRSPYPPSSGAGSAATGKYSNGSSFTTGKKNSSGTTDNTLPQSLGEIPLLPQQSCSRPFSPAVTGNVIIQDSLMFDPSANSCSVTHFNPANEQIHFPQQQVNFPHSNSRVSNSSHPNTNSSSSNCSDHTNMSYSNSLQPNFKGPKSQSNSQSSNNQQCPPSIAFSVTSSHPSNCPVPPYYIQPGFESNLANNQANSHVYPHYTETIALVNSNQLCNPDYFIGHNSSSPSNTYSFT